jgi:hypothetical protein
MNLGATPEGNAMSQNQNYRHPISVHQPSPQMVWPGKSSKVAHIKQRLDPLRAQLLKHEVYDRIQTLAQLRVYMEHHVFAVWDFMSLLKALQQNLTCVSLPWVPTADPLSRRLINEIVLSEESDNTEDGSYTSHFELYLAAMSQCGADRSAINRFLTILPSATSLDRALTVGRVPPAALEFVRSTWQVIETGKPHMIAAAFALGREEVIPEMFQSLTKGMAGRFPEQLRIFNDYLERHIRLDGDQHSPMALVMLQKLCGEDERKQEEVEKAARIALLARIKLWDGVLRELIPMC